MVNHSSYQPFRRHQRFTAKARALVIFRVISHNLPFHIIDICDGGLSFRYLGKKIKTSKTPTINLYYEFELIVGDLPVKEVSDYQLRDDIVPVRRKSLCFESLSIEQHNRLSFFIEVFTSRNLDEPIRQIRGKMAFPSWVGHS